jgi:hypothetical protein
MSDTASFIIMMLLLNPPIPGTKPNNNSTGPTFIECLPKWDGSKLEQPEKCKSAPNEKTSSNKVE